MNPPHFYIFVIISLLKRIWPFIWTNLNSLHPGIICIKFNWIWPADSGEEDFKKCSVYFYTFAIISPWRMAIPFVWRGYYLPLEKGIPLRLNKLESPLPKDDLCQVWLKLALVDLEKIFKRLHPIFTFLLSFHLWRGPGPLFKKKPWNPFTRG
jgi:hypothetical protein